MKYKIQIINGPNLNLLGKREPEIYGNISFENYLETLKVKFPSVEIHYFQSNHEGALIDKIQEVGFDFDGIILNAGAYSHYSYAIADAIRAITTPVVEVHISDVMKREAFRQTLITAEPCQKIISGKGLRGYDEAIAYFFNLQRS